MTLPPIPPQLLDGTCPVCGAQRGRCQCPPLEKAAGLFLAFLEYFAPRLQDPATRQDLAQGLAHWALQRPTRRRKIPAQDFPAHKQAAEREWVETYGALPTLEDLAAMLGISRRTLVTYLQGLPEKNVDDA